MYFKPPQQLRKTRNAPVGAPMQTGLPVMPVRPMPPQSLPPSGSPLAQPPMARPPGMAPQQMSPPGGVISGAMKPPVAR